MVEKTYQKFDLENDSLEYEFDYNKDDTSDLHRELNFATNVSMDQIRKVALWKYNRIISIDDSLLEKLGKLSEEKNLKITDPSVKEIVEEMVGSRGIGFPLASAVLKFLNPSVFPIIDVRAYRALTGKKPNSQSYTYKKYIEYALALMNIAKATDKKLREIDEQLYCFDEIMNGKI